MPESREPVSVYDIPAYVYRRGRWDGLSNREHFEKAVRKAEEQGAVIQRTLRGGFLGGLLMLFGYERWDNLKIAGRVTVLDGLFIEMLIIARR